MNKLKKHMSIINISTKKGITLIALIITIIVLLILIGITVLMFTGENGVLNKATQASSNTSEGEIEEKIRLEIMASYNDDGTFNKRVFIENLKEDLGINEESIKELENGNIGIEYEGYIILVESNGKDIKLKNGSMVQKEVVDIKSAFTWQSSVSETIGTISIENNGSDVTFTGNENTAGKNAIWVIPTTDKKSKFTFNYNIEFGDSFKAAGMLLRVSQTGSNKLTGYMLSFNKNGQDYYTNSGNSLGGLWSFSYDGNNLTAMEKTLIAPLALNPSGTLTVEVSSTEITIEGGGLTSKYVHSLGSNPGGSGYGFFSEHYSHGCADKGNFSLTGLTLEVGEDKWSFEEF